MKMWKKILSVCFLALCMLFVGKTDTQAATYTLPVSDSWTDGELTQQGGYNFYRVTIPEAGTLTDSFSAAMPLSGIPTIHGMLAQNEDFDYYRFSLSQETPVKIRYINYYNSAMPEPGVDGIIDIYTSDYVVLEHKRPINRDFLFEKTLSPGTYYIKISKFYGGSGKYILQYSVNTPTLLGSGGIDHPESLRINHF